MYSLIRRALFQFEPERAHAVASKSLQFARALRLPVAPALERSAAVELMGLRFPNRVGLAAGFDKSGHYIDALGALGFGFIEIGTVTPLPQPGQVKPRIFRLEQADAIINRMGFPNEGADAVAARLARRTYGGICGINIGKNAATPLERAIDDYVACFRKLAPHADYVVINVSSPNTTGLRQLQSRDMLEPIVAALQQERSQLRDRGPLPILIKIAPDLTAEQIENMAAALREMRLDGVIATNTTLSRVGVEQLPGAEEQGGLSGRPLHRRSLEVIGALRRSLGPDFPIIGAGGIDSAAAAAAALEAGANLVQVYTGFIYRGPALITAIRRHLA